MKNENQNRSQPTPNSPAGRGWMIRLVRLLVCVWDSPYTQKWMSISIAPRDGNDIIVYCPPAHGLNHLVSVCAWHEDAGFCVCELREPTLWIPLPNVDVEARRPNAPPQQDGL